MAGLLVALVLAGCAAQPGPGTTSASPSAGTSTRQDVVAADQWAVGRQAAARRVLEAQADAVRRVDQDGFLRPVDAAERDPARARFQRMVEIGVGELTLVSLNEVVPPVPSAPNTAVTWDVEATYDYRITGFDRGPRRFTFTLSLKAAPAEPERLRITRTEPGERPQPWDLQGMQVRRSARALVVGNAADLDEVLSRADRAAVAVERVLRPVAPAVWVVPGDVAQAERLLGRQPGELGDVAAATDGPLETGAPARADRIVLNPQAWSSLQPTGRDVVMRHELTHASVRATTTGPVPLWLSEGLAEYVAYKDVAVADRAVAASLVDRLRREGLPEHLPGPERFDPGAGSLSAAYAESWLAVRTLVSLHGEDAVVSMYQSAARAASASAAADTEGAADDALARLGTPRPELERAWRAELRRLAAS